MKRILFSLGFLSGSACIFAACGSRSQLLATHSRDAGTTDASVQCVTVEDCTADPTDLCHPVTCVHGTCDFGAVKVCTDNDPCTEDTCDPASGQCVFQPSTLDLDGDGHHGPKPGTVAGAPGSCGDDCDDTSPKAYPGNTEVCDGFDNDCNGVVDDGAEFVPKPGAADGVRVSSSLLTRSLPAGMAQDGAKYFAAYDGFVQGKDRIFGSMLDVDGTRLTQESRLVNVEADGFGGPVVWTGDRFAMAWEDRRFTNYEVFFAMFDANGQKMAPGDVRLSSTPDFSLNPTMVWTGREFVVVWQDGQNGSGDSYNLFGRRVGLDGVPIGGAMQITSGGRDESPSLAVGQPGLGLVWNSGTAGNTVVLFQPLDFTLSPLASQVSLTGLGDNRDPALVWNKQNFVVAWTEHPSNFRIRATVIDGVGKTITPATSITDSTSNGRFAQVIPFGDRLLEVYSDDRDHNQGYELYSRTWSSTLQAIGAPARVTNHIGDSFASVARRGPQGEVGVLFGDSRDGAAQTYFTHLVCQIAK